ncbi:MAG: hypothetical protein GXO65_03930 [Euryarchaeota archaeon]|nr:hypothetical protein [Euryarchaeota archaeon]
MSWITGVFGLALIGLALFSPGPGGLDAILDGASPDANASGEVAQANVTLFEEPPGPGGGAVPGAEVSPAAPPS